MTIRLVTGKKIAETSSKGNQEKWYDAQQDVWYKLDQFGYEALTETVVSTLLESSNIKLETPFSFVRYQMEKLHVHGQERTGCSSKNFLQKGQHLVTISRLLSRHLGCPVSEKLSRLSSDKKRIAYLADATADHTSLDHFPEYLTLLFEVDALFCNDDRHLNNIAVLEQNGIYSYCPIFDQGAGLLSNTMISRMDISPKALISALRAQPLDTTFTRLRNSAQSLYGPQLKMPKFSRSELADVIVPLLLYYPERDRSIILDRVTECILLRKKA